VHNTIFLRHPFRTGHRPPGGPVEVLPEAWILGWEVQVFRGGRGSLEGNRGDLGEWGKPLGVRERRRVVE